MRLAFPIILVFLTIFLVPVVVYGTWSQLTGLQPPGGGFTFLAGVAVSKLGTAIAFVGIWALGRSSFDGRWVLYGGLWWVMFALGEIGQAIGPHYTAAEAIAGIIAETIYLPLAALLIAPMRGPK